MEATTTNQVSKVLIVKPGEVKVGHEEKQPLQDGDFFVETVYSGISAGTELTFFLGTNPKQSEGWDEANRLFRGDLEPSIVDIFPKCEGYMEVGKVTESRNKDVPVGAFIATEYGHKSGHTMHAQDRYTMLPDWMDPMMGIWVHKMGPISMMGILYAADEVQRGVVPKLQGSLDGQRVIVFGAGMIGLLCGAFAKWAGAQEVMIVDGIQERLDAAEKIGLTPIMAHVGLPLEVKERWTAKDAMDTGADIAIQCTGSDFLLEQAFACLREQGTVIDLGFYQQGAAQVMFGKEFHHNRLRHVCAQIGAIPRHQQAEWDRARLSQETIAFLKDNGQALKDHLVTHIAPFKEAQDILDKLASRDPSMLQVVLQPE